ncbi:MAG: TrgA family protein [Pseudomonadota bacterium]
MPTMAKLSSAILMGILGYVVADLVGGHLPEEMRQKSLRWVTAVFGVLVGWRFLGPRVRGDWTSSVGLGLSAGLVLFIVALFWFAGYEMLRKAQRLAYGGDPIEALEDMVAIAVEYLAHLAYSDVIGTAVVGSIIVGVVVTMIARRWP